MTVSLRIPHDLAEQMKRYAARHRQTVTELLLDGLQWRLEQDDPRLQAAQDMSYYDNTVLHELAKPTYLVDDRIPCDAELPPTPPDAPEEPPAVQQASQPVQRQAEAAMVAGAPPTATAVAAVPPFDHGKHHLGTLCRAGHEWGKTGQSLRANNKAGYCLACNAALNVEHKRAARKRQAQPV